MGDYVDGTIYIGGRLQRSQIGRLVTALQRDLGSEFDESQLMTAMRTPTGNLCFIAEQLPDGEFQSLQDLRAIGLTVMAVRGAGDNYPVATFYVSPDLPGITVIPESEREAYISLSGLQRAREQGKTVDEIIASICPPFKWPPPFVVTSVALDDIGCDGAVAAARALLGERR